LSDEEREKSVEDGLVKAVSAIFIERRRYHQPNNRLRGQTQKRGDEVGVVRKVILCMCAPIVVSGIVGSEHDQHDLRVRIEYHMIFAFIPIWLIASSQECGSPNTIVSDIVSRAEEILELRGIVEATGRKVTCRDAVPHTGNLLCCWAGYYGW